MAVSPFRQHYSIPEEPTDDSPYPRSSHSLGPLPTQFSRVGASGSNFELYYARLSLRPTGRCLRLLPPRLFPTILPSIVCFNSQFVHKQCQIKLTFLRFTVCGIFLSSLTCFFYTVGLLIFSILLQHILKLLRYFWYIFRSVQVSASCRATHGELIFCMSL